MKFYHILLWLIIFLPYQMNIIEERQFHICLVAYVSLIYICAFVNIILPIFSISQSKRGKKLTPDKQHPAGVLSVISHDDPRLVKSSQNPQRPFFPHATVRSVQAFPLTSYYLDEFLFWLCLFLSSKGSADKNDVENDYDVSIKLSSVFPQYCTAKYNVF